MFGQFLTRSSLSFLRCSLRKSSSFLGGGLVKERKRSISVPEMQRGAAAFLRVVRIVPAARAARPLLEMSFSVVARGPGSFRGSRAAATGLLGGCSASN